MDTNNPFLMPRCDVCGQVIDPVMESSIATGKRISITCHSSRSIDVPMETPLENALRLLDVSFVEI